MRGRGAAALVAVATVLALTAGCSGSGSAGGAASSAASASDSGTFVFAAAVDPMALDPAVVTDPDSLRITRQIFETLVDLPDQPVAATPSASAAASAGTASAAVDDTVVPGLATSWSASNGGQTYTFSLRQGVKFQDGTPFGPSAVCANFDRWFTLSGRAADPDVSAVYQEVFGGFIDHPGSRYQGCTVLGPQQIRLDLTAPMPGLLTQLARPQFGIQSPTAMENYGAYGSGDPRTTAYATAHPTGTGPFRFGAWEPGVQVVLVRNPDYWGQKAAVERVIVKPVNDPKARADQLLKGQIDAYDQVTALEVGSLTADPKAGIRLVARARRDLTYLGIDRDSKVLHDPRVRRAVAMAIDPAALVARTMPPGSTVADGLVPGVAQPRTYPYDPAQARRLLAEAGATGLKVRVAYPSGVQQGYLPAPEDLYVAVAEQLKAVGITAEPVAMSWPAYLQMLGSTADRPDLHLMGVAADDPEPSSTVMQLVSGAPQEFGSGPTSATVASIVSQPAGAGRDRAVSAAEQQLLTDPGVVPIAFPIEQVALGPRVRNYTVRPYGDEVWTQVRVTG